VKKLSLILTEMITKLVILTGVAEAVTNKIIVVKKLATPVLILAKTNSYPTN